MGSYYQKIIIKNLAPVIYGMGIHRLTKPFYEGIGQILMFHRVIPKSKSERIHNHLSLEISPEHLEQILLYYHRNGYSAITLDDLPIWLNEKQNKKFVIYTFDDGYKDNLEFAYPVFKKYKSPFTIYITSIFPDKKAILWWYILEAILHRNSKIEYAFPTETVNIICSSYKSKQLAFNTLRKLFISFDNENLQTLLTGFFNKYDYDIYAMNEELVLSWDLIRELSADNIVTIGAHTINHYNLTKLSDKNAIEEIIGSKERIESEIGRNVHHFSYPLGLYTQREIELVKESGFKTATTTRISNIFKEHITQCYNLPRFPINTLSNQKVLELQCNGIFHIPANGFSRIQS